MSSTCPWRRSVTRVIANESPTDDLVEVGFAKASLLSANAVERSGLSSPCVGFLDRFDCRKLGHCSIEVFHHKAFTGRFGTSSEKGECFAPRFQDRGVI